jgi:hypothetical protein
VDACSQVGEGLLFKGAGLQCVCSMPGPPTLMVRALGSGDLQRHGNVKAGGPFTVSRLHMGHMRCT